MRDEFAKTKYFFCSGRQGEKPVQLVISQHLQNVLCGNGKRRLDYKLVRVTLGFVYTQVTFVSSAFFPSNKALLWLLPLSTAGQTLTPNLGLWRKRMFLCASTVLYPVWGCTLPSDTHKQLLTNWEQEGLCCACVQGNIYWGIKLRGNGGRNQLSQDCFSAPWHWCAPRGA